MQMSFLTRVFGLLLFAAAAFPASAQPYPNRPLRLIVPYPAGGQPDTVARIVSKQMSLALGQPINVDNIGGGSGIPAIIALTGARPDGHTLIVMDAGHWAISPAARSTPVPYDPVKSFTPVGLVTTSSLFIAVNEAVAATSLAELVSLVRQKPGALNYGSAGIGSVHHLTIEALKQALGLDMVHVPFRGTSQSVPALVGGQVQVVVATLGGLVQFEKAGRIRILAANTIGRSALAPTVPSVSEVAPNLDFPGQVGLFGPAGMPKDVVDRLSAAVEDAMKSPEVLAALKVGGVEPAPARSPEALARRIQDDRARYGALIKATGIQLE